MHEDRTLHFEDFVVTLSYNKDGKSDILTIRSAWIKDRAAIAIVSTVNPDFIEQIYELLRECEMTRKDN